MLKKYKVLLINPPIECFYILTSGSRHFPTGLLYISHALRRRNCEIKIFDSLLYKCDSYILPQSNLSLARRDMIQSHPIFNYAIHFGASWQRLGQYIAVYRPDIVGISSQFSFSYRQSIKTAEIVKEIVPDAKIFIGGANATVAWKNLLLNSNVDAVFIGESDISILNLIKILESESLDSINSFDIETVPGISIRKDNGEINTNLNRSIPGNLDDIGFPALDNIDYSLYNYTVSIITSRGCPFSCSFCAVSNLFGKKIRKRSVENVLEELRYYQKKGIRVINIEDDNISYDMDRLVHLMEKICEEKFDFKIQFPNGISSINMTKDIISLFARAGVKQLFFGLESYNDNTRIMLNKKYVDTNQLNQLVRFGQIHGIYAFTSLITSLPNQNKYDIVNDIFNAFQNGLNGCVNPYYPIPETELYNVINEDGRLKLDDFEYLEPLNFPFIENSVMKKDVTNTFILGLVLNNPKLLPFHKLFLLNEKKLDLIDLVPVLEKLSIINRVISNCELLLYPIGKCFCEYYNLRQNYLSKVNNFCSFSGTILAILTQLWSARLCIFTEIQCKMNQSENCIFKITQKDDEPEVVIQYFLSLCNKKKNKIKLEKLLAEYDNTSVFYNESYYGSGY